MARGSLNSQRVRASAKIPAIEILRGLASLAVAWFHITGGFQSFLRTSGEHGWLGVECFFVISGFVIPLSIQRTYDAFGLKDAPRFLLRRLVRIEPPYLLSVLLAAGVAYASANLPGFRGRPFDFSIGQLLAHVAYVIPLTSYDWLQRTYWTLAFEFVFYLFSAGCFGLLAGRPWLWLAFVGLAIGASFVGLPPHFMLFVPGIAVFRRVALDDAPALTFGVIAAASASLAVTVDYPTALVGFLTAVVILATRHWQFSGLGSKAFLWLGSVSYSLYLVHDLVAGRVINLGFRFMPRSWSSELFLALLALALSLVAAAVFARLVERPAIRASRSLDRRLRERRQQAAPAAG